MDSPLRAPTPVEHQIRVLREALASSHASEQARFTLADLIAALGTGSHILVILVFSVLNMIPGPPGYGGTVALAIVFFAATLALGAPLRLHPWLGQRRLPVRALLRVTGLFARIAAFFGRFSRPRLRFLSAPATTPLLALFIIAVSLPMMVPIPFINAVPNLGICIMCLGWINRDGLAVIAGVGVALIGLLIAGLAIFGAYHLVNAALDAAR